MLKTAVVLALGWGQGTAFVLGPAAVGRPVTPGLPRGAAAVPLSPAPSLPPSSSSWRTPLRSSLDDTGMEMEEDTSPSDSGDYTFTGDDFPSPMDPELEARLLDAVYAGVGEGYLVNSNEDKEAIAAIVAEVEASGQGTDVTYPRDLSKLDGRWRLLYTSNLLGLGKLSPLTLDDVYQVVDVSGDSIKNVVYTTMSPPLFAETWGRLGAKVAEVAEAFEKRVSFKVDFSIDHSFTVASQSSPAQVELVVRNVKVINSEDEGSRSLVLPAVQPLAKAGAGRFDTTVLSDDIRVSRGRFGELRVFQRA